MKAMIFAAGFGKRLQPLTLKIPKALVEVKGRSMLDWIIDRLIQHGVSELIINTHFLHTAILAYIKSKTYSIPITLSHEETILGTGGGLYQTRHFWDDTDFLVYNVDILCDADLTAFVDFHKNQKAIVTLAINERISKSMLLVDQAGFLVGRSLEGVWQLLKKASGSVKEVGFCGFQAISPTFLNRTPPPRSFSIIDDYMNLLKAGEAVLTWSIEKAYWEDIGTPEALQRAVSEFPG